MPGPPVLYKPAAGVPYETAAGDLDFHALRQSYITHGSLIRSGANPKVVQMLARHSTITLTLDRYTHVDGGNRPKAFQGRDDGEGD